MKTLERRWLTSSEDFMDWFPQWNVLVDKKSLIVFQLPGTKRPWRGGSRLSSLCEMPTQRVEGWRACFFSLPTGIMKINFWQSVEAVCGVLIFVSTFRNKGIYNNLWSVEGLQCKEKVGSDKYLPSSKPSSLLQPLPLILHKAEKIFFFDQSKVLH